MLGWLSSCLNSPSLPGIPSAPPPQPKAEHLPSASLTHTSLQCEFLVLRSRLISSSFVFLRTPLQEPLFYLLILSSFFILRPPPPHRIDLSHGISPVLRVVKRCQNCMYMRGKLKLEKPVYSSQRDSSVSKSIL